MSLTDMEQAELEFLRERVEHLEAINRWHIDSLNMLTAMEEIHGETTTLRDPEQIFISTTQYLAHIVHFSISSFLTVNEEDSSFHLCYSNQPQAQYQLLQIVDELIDSGEFAWAINQNRPVEVRIADFPYRIVLHVLATKNRVRGMFLGVLDNRSLLLSSPLQNLLSIVLNNCAYALESAALYQFVNHHNQLLERTIQQRTAELQFQSVHDSLTGLSNRVLFQNRLEQEMRYANSHDSMVAILLIDLDMFKRINDTFGHSFGDELLTTVAIRLENSCKSEKVCSGNNKIVSQLPVARLGGDEFAILVPNLTTIDPISHIVQQVTEDISAEILLQGQSIFITFSLGISIYPKDGSDTLTLLKNADAAMYHAKKSGRNRYQYYANEMNEAAFNKLKLENQLRFAIDRNEFVLHYQPKIHLSSGRIESMEALVRWDHPDMGLLSPLEFIPIAESSGLINQIGDLVMQMACKQIQQWQKQYRRPFRIAVNLSPQQFRQPDVLDKIVSCVKTAKIDPTYLEIEITESAIMDNVTNAIATMKKMREYGLTLAIDDFGTGYSSLSNLKRFPVHTLKIDRSFVTDIISDSDDASIVIAIIGMAHNMGLDVVAEGVETEQQHIFLQALKCDVIQGYFFSRPITADKMSLLLKQQQTI